MGKSWDLAAEYIAVAAEGASLELAGVREELPRAATTGRIQGLRGSVSRWAEMEAFHQLASAFANGAPLGPSFWECIGLHARLVVWSAADTLAPPQLFARVCFARCVQIVLLEKAAEPHRYLSEAVVRPLPSQRQDIAGVCAVLEALGTPTAPVGWFSTTDVPSPYSKLAAAVVERDAAQLDASSEAVLEHRRRRRRRGDSPFFGIFDLFPAEVVAARVFGGGGSDPTGLDRRPDWLHAFDARDALGPPPRLPTDVRRGLAILENSRKSNSDAAQSALTSQAAADAVAARLAETAASLPKAPPPTADARRGRLHRRGAG